MDELILKSKTFDLWMFLFEINVIMFILVTPSEYMHNFIAIIGRKDLLLFMVQCGQLFIACHGFPILVVFIKPEYVKYKF